VKLISEFLDLDAPYVPGKRQTNAEHFAHGSSSFPFHLTCRLLNDSKRSIATSGHLTKTFSCTTTSSRYANQTAILDHHSFLCSMTLLLNCSYQRKSLVDAGGTIFLVLAHGHGHGHVLPSLSKVPAEGLNKKFTPDNARGHPLVHLIQLPRVYWRKHQGSSEYKPGWRMVGCLLHMIEVRDKMTRF
jgi:hypothetical protein